MKDKFKKLVANMDKQDVKDALWVTVGLMFATGYLIRSCKQ